MIYEKILYLCGNAEGIHFFEMVKTCQAPNKVCKNEEAPPRGFPPQITLGGRLDPTLDLLLYYHSLICVLLCCDKTLFKHCTMSQNLVQ